MDLLHAADNNVAEVLDKIVEFSHRRGAVLKANISEVDNDGFKPKDLDVAGFAELMAYALAEHVHNNRLVLYDNDTVKFGTNGEFECRTMVDDEAFELLTSDKKRYLQLQVKKLTENLLNSKMACLLRSRVFDHGSDKRSRDCHSKTV